MLRGEYPKLNRCGMTCILSSFGIISFEMLNKVVGLCSAPELLRDSDDWYPPLMVTLNYLFFERSIRIKFVPYLSFRFNLFLL